MLKRACVYVTPWFCGCEYRSRANAHRGKNGPSLSHYLKQSTTNLDASLACATLHGCCITCNVKYLIWHFYRRLIAYTQIHFLWPQKNGRGIGLAYSTSSLPLLSLCLALSIAGNSTRVRTAFHTVVSSPSSGRWGSHTHTHALKTSSEKTRRQA